MGFFDDLQTMKEISLRTSETIGGPFGDPFNEIGTIISVSDPKGLGRVKVLSSGIESDWVYVQGSHKGQLSSQYIGAPCLLSKAGGNTNDAFVSQIFNKDPRGNGVGTPIQLTVLGEQMEAGNIASDPGMRCNENNSGRVYLLENEVSQDVVVCLRRNNTQEGGDPVYAWKSLTHGKLVEKGFDPGIAQSPENTDLSKKSGMPKCSQALEGEIREFAEDRKFRSTMLMCRRDENGDFSWSPVSSPPVVFKTTLPSCTEKNHGMEAIIDPGDNSELAICLRYQGQMKWVHPGTRRPVQFYPGEKPMSRKDFLASKKPMEALAQNASPSSQDFVGKAGSAILKAAGGAIAPIASDPALKAAMIAANALPGQFNGADMLSNLAKIAIANNSNQSIDALTSQITNAINRGGIIDDELAAVLRTAGGAGDVLARGIQNNTLDSALQIIGKNSLNQAFNGLPSQVAGVYSAYMAGGALGAIDSAAMLGLSQLPPEVAQFVSPVWDIGKDILNGQPLSINNVIGSAVGALDLSLPDSINQIISTAGGIGGISDIVSGDIIGKLSGGDFGEIAQMATNFANLPGIPNLGGLQGVPQLATSALQLVGLGGQFTSFLGPAGLGLSAFSALTGINPVSSILGGIPGLGGLFGGGGLDCPCDPKCRKTEHGVDSDGNRLLDPCGNVLKSGHSSYSPSGNPIDNNNNPITDFLPTQLGEELCVKNPFDLTKILKAVSRLRDLADRMEGAKNADFPELFSELIYSLEAIEKALKQADNNISKVESIERKLIDAQYRTMRKFFSSSFSYFPLAMKDMTEHAKAITDLYQYVKRLDSAKDGPRIGAVPTPAIILTKKNIKQIPKLSKKSRAEAALTINKALKPAHKEWKQLSPGEGLLEAADIILGLFNPDVPINFDGCKTTNNKDKVLKDSLESKINSPEPPDPSSLLGNSLPTKYFDLPNSDLSPNDQQQISSLLDQIDYEQGRSREGKADC